MGENGINSFRSDVMWPNWPTSLPNPELMRHWYAFFFFFGRPFVLTLTRVDVFFTFHPHAGRLFHTPSFMNSLSLPPTHPKFPSLPVLHAICAIGSLYTAAVTSPPLPNYDEVSPGLFT